MLVSLDFFLGTLLAIELKLLLSTEDFLDGVAPRFLLSNESDPAWFNCPMNGILTGSTLIDLSESLERGSDELELELTDETEFSLLSLTESFNCCTFGFFL